MEDGRRNCMPLKLPQLLSQFKAWGTNQTETQPRRKESLSSPTTSFRGLFKATFGWLFFGAPSMGALLRVQVSSQVDHSKRDEAQMYEGDRVWEESVEREVSRGRSSSSRGPMRRSEKDEGPNESERPRTRRCQKPSVRCRGNPGGWT